MRDAQNFLTNQILKRPKLQLAILYRMSHSNLNSSLPHKIHTCLAVAYNSGASRRKYLHYLNKKYYFEELSVYLIILKHFRDSDNIFF